MGSVQLPRMFMHLLLFAVLFCFPLFVHAADDDNDGLSNEEELAYYTNPGVADTDGDGYLDGIEVKHGYSPLAGEGTRMHQHDYDGDGLNDWVEGWFGSDRGNGDTDGDGSSDLEEVLFGRSPRGDVGKAFVRKLVVDRAAQHLYVYVDGMHVKSYPVSTGNPHTPTPPGQFTIQRKVEEKSYVGPGYNLPGVKWNMQFKPMYYIHTAYWHDKFGAQTASHGCVNMREEDAGELYTYVPVGTEVEVIGQTPLR